MLVLKQFPFLKKKYEGGYFTRILNRHFPALAYFAGRTGIPVYNLIEELLSLAFTDRVIALERYTPDFIYQKVYSEKIPDALPKDSFLMLSSEEQFLVASLIIYLIRIDVLDYNHRCQLNHLNTILYACRLVHRKKVQVVGVFCVKSNFCTVTISKNIKRDVEYIQNNYERNYIRLYNLDEHGDQFVAVTKEFIEFIMTLPERFEEWIDSKLKKMISRFYEQYKKDIVQYTQIVNQVIADQFKKPLPGN